MKTILLISAVTWSLTSFSQTTEESNKSEEKIASEKVAEKQTEKKRGVVSAKDLKGKTLIKPKAVSIQAPKQEENSEEIQNQ